ncbi:MAG: transglycosylase SLT domain-containing protein [Chloroflexi bacterium]|nr:transglycosylase SLT domain-containing protein [Chloroflexota bacterium]
MNVRTHPWLFTLLLLALSAILCGCGVQPSEPSPVVPPSATPALSAEPPAPSPTLASTPLPQPTASQPPTPAQLPDATATPAPTAGLAVPPDALSAAALKASDDGDWERAVALWQQAIAAAEPSARPALQVALARTLMQRGDALSAITPLNEALAAAPPEPTGSVAWGLLGSAHQQLGSWRSAAEAYAQHLARNTSSEPYVRWQMARCYNALDERAREAEELAAVDLDGLPAATQAEILEERAEALRALQRYDEALASYDAILDISSIANYIALVQHKRAETLQEAGRIADAVTLWLTVAREHPSSSAAYLSLQALDRLGAAAPLSGLLRGEILYHAGQYNAALGTLRDYVANAGADALDRAHYYVGLCQTRLQQHPAAYAAFDALIEGMPSSALLTEAWFAKARAAQAAGSDPTGLYLEYAVRLPSNTRAAEALWLAASGREQARDWAEAARLYQRLHSGYPGDSRAPEAHFREGLARYAQQDMATAYAIWAAALAASSSAGERARLNTWLGLATADAAAAQAHWRAAAEAAPESYYGLRAQDLAAGRAPLLPEQPHTQVPDANLSAADWDALAEWIDSWQSALRLTAPAAPLQRAATLLSLDWRAQALDVLAAQRSALRSDPHGLLALARFAVDQRLYGESIQCAERILFLSRAAQAGAPPETLLHLAYPTAYGDLVSAHAAAYSVDALLFLALVRQESRFDARAVSYAGASGLTQVMPATGRDIAARLRDDDYTQEMLSWPVVSVRYGVWYLSWLLDLCERDWVAALISYNAAYGRLRQWTGEGPIHDHDLLYETMTVDQPRAYVRRIYEGYAMYQALYAR